MKKWEELSYAEKLACISLYPEEAKKNQDWAIRRATYRALGYTEEAKKDQDWAIRREAYRALGYTEEAKQDKSSSIRQEAEIYLRVKEGICAA